MLDEEDRQEDEKLPLCYNKSRHTSLHVQIEQNVCNNLWRMRERVRQFFGEGEASRIKTIHYFFVLDENCECCISCLFKCWRGST